MAEERSDAAPPGEAAAPPISEHRQVIDVSAGLIFCEGRVLITQRRHGSHLGGLWEFPGGKREPRETFEACLRRELREELDITVEVGALIESITHCYPEKTVRLKFYRCELREGQPRAVGCPAFRWVRRDELDQYPFPAADARLLDKLRNAGELWH